MNKSILVVLIAHTLSKYDIFLFGFLAPIIKPLFFPATDTVAVLSTFGSFAAGYVMRPIGAIFFSHIGDKFGRKNSFLATVFLILLPTLAIGLMPDYSQIGILAPILLILCRIIQGFCSGGEFSGAAVYVTESYSNKQEGIAGGLVRSVGFLGTAIGTFIASFAVLPMMPGWGWRIPFLIGAGMTIISFYLRTQMEETLTFSQLKNKNETEKFPMGIVIKKYKKNFIASFLITACAYIFLYMSTIYINSQYTTVLNISTSASLWISTGIMLLWMVITPFSGFISDKVGAVKFLKKISLISIISLFPIFYLSYYYKNLYSILIAQIILSILGGLFFGPIPGLIKKNFPTKVRYSGFSLSNTTAQAILGGTAPFYSSLLVTLTGSEVSPSILMIIGCVLGIVGLKIVEENKWKY
jgi:MHS family proline/betaine transporter-like MFS transporter